MKHILLFALIVLLVPCMTGCGTGESPISEIDNMSGISSEIIFSDVYDITVKTQVEIHYNIWGEINSENVEEFLLSKYREVALSTGYEFREHPSAIYLLAYLPGDSEVIWTGYLHLDPTGIEPIFECSLDRDIILSVSRSGEIEKLYSEDLYTTLNNCVDAIGGGEAVRNIRVIHTIDSLFMAGMTGMTESWWVRDPFMGFSVTEIGPIKQQVLILGDSVWTVDRNGHLSPGGMEQRDQMMLSRVTIFYDYLFDASMVSIGADTLIDSVAAVPMRLEDQPNVVFYYSKETWLPLLMTAVTMGIEVRSYPDDYENIEGIVSATSSISTIPAMGQEIVNWNILTEYNVVVPESIFVLTSAGGDWELDNPGTPTSFSFKGEHIYLDGEVNGNPVTILLDSGAGATVLDSALAAELGLEGTGNLPARGIGGTREFSFVKVPTYYAAGALLSDQTLAVMPLSEEFYPSTGEMIDLIIGYDFLSRFVTRIDYGSETITLFDPDSFSIDSDNISILPAERSMSLLSIEAVLEDSVPVTLLLDTGAGGSIHLTPSFFENHPEFMNGRPTFETVIQGVGGEETISGFRVGEITLGDYTVPCGLCSSFDGGDMFSQYDGILGNAVLSRFILYLDYSSGRIILEPSSLFEEGLPESLTGMGLEIENNNLLVSKVIQGSPAEEAGILEGDILLEINGNPVTAEELNDLSNLLPDTVGAAVSLRFKRNGTEIDLELITGHLVPMHIEGN